MDGCPFLRFCLKLAAGGVLCVLRDLRSFRVVVMKALKKTMKAMKAPKKTMKAMKAAALHLLLWKVVFVCIFWAFQNALGFVFQNCGVFY